MSTDMLGAVFTEALFARLLPVNYETTIDAMANFATDETLLQHLLAAALGAIVAYGILYWVGTRMRKLPERVSSPEERERVAALGRKAKFFLPFLLVLSPTPFGTVILVACGFFRLNPWLTFAIAIAAELAWRIAIFGKAVQ